MKIAQVVMSIVVLFCTLTSFAADGVWSNAAGGNWSTASNWNGNTIASGAGASATLNGPIAAPVVIDADYTVGMLIASPYAYILNGETTARILKLDNGTNPSEVSVAAGGSLTTGVRLDAKNKGLIKTGPGLWTLNNRASNISGMVIEAGDVILDLGVGGDGLNVGDNTIELKSGTSLKYMDNNLINNTAVLDIRSGAVLDLNYKTDNFGAFTGNGVVSNLTTSQNFWLQDRTMTFSGYAYGTSGGNVRLFTPGTFVLGASNALEQVGVNMDVVDTMLAFTPGIGSFWLGWLKSINPITLEAQDDKPIQLSLGTSASSTIQADINGSGGLTVDGGADLTIHADTSYTGPTIVKGGTLTLGDGVTYNGAITNSSSITVMSGKTLNIENKNAMTYPNSITGKGYINKNQSSDISFNSMNMQGGQLNVNNGTAIINGGSSSNLSIRVDKGNALVVNGGHFIDSSINIISEGSLNGSSSVTLKNGSSENLNYYNNNLLSSLDVTGGDWHFDTSFSDYKKTFIYTQSGGKADFGVSKGMYNTNRVFGYISGGELNIRYVFPPRGLGLLVSGDGKVTMEGTQRLASDGWSYDFIITNNAYVKGDTIQLMSRGDAGSDLLLELAGGTLAFNSMNNDASNCDQDNTIQFNFNGGILRPKYSSTTYENPLYSTFSVFEGGALMDIATSGNYNFEPTLYSGLSGVEDGGLVKSGLGRLDLYNPMRYTGETVVNGGLLRTLSMDASPLSSNTVYIKNGEIRVQSGSSGSENLVQKLAYAAADDSLVFGGGAARLSLDRPSSGSLALEIGNSAATQDSALNRIDNGVLMVTPFEGLGASNFGVNESVVINGGLSTTNGMVAPYIMGTIWGNGWYGGSFLDYDGAKGLIEASYTSGLAGGASSVAELSSDASTDSAHVYALRLTGTDLTVNNGETLTIGDGINPAGLILNRNSSDYSSIQGGTVDFRNSEGIIYLSTYDSTGHTISSTIAGEKGLTITGYGNSEILNLNAPAGNTYLGDTHILNGRVTVANTAGFSSGDLYIHGDDLVGGCFLFDFAETITNAMHLAGIGGALYYGYGAVSFRNTSEGVIDAPVELMRNTRIGADGALSVGRFSQSITGTGELEINIARTDVSAGTIIFGAANSYNGRTVINQGKLKIDEGGTLGIGDVVNNGTLIFNNSSAQMVTNSIDGSGKVTKTSSGTLTLSGDIDCDIEIQDGSVVLASGAVLPGTGISGILDVNGQNIAINELNGTGSITNSSTSTATLDLDIAADTDSIYWGSISDGGNTIRLNKNGAGTLILGGSNSYQGETTISEGTVKLSTVIDQAPYLSDIAYQLDASTANTLTLSGSNVTTWADSSGNGNDFVQAIADQYNQYPFYVADAINGKGAIRFEGNWNRLYATNTVDNQTVIIVNNKTGQMDLSGIWGKSDADYGVRAANSTTWQDGDQNDFARGAAFYVNGVNTRSYIQGTPHMLTATSATVKNFAGAVGDYWGNAGGYHRAYIGDIGEVLVYKTALDMSQRQIAEKYLNDKWFGNAVSTVLTNVLPETTDLIVDKNGVLDLAGSVQSVASLSGEGNILSSGEGSAELTVGTDNSDTFFGGSIADLNLFTKAGSGLLTLTGISSYTGETIISDGTLRLGDGANRLDSASSVTVESGAIFDVNYTSQTLDSIGGSGTVMDCDGLTVTGSVAPGGVGDVGTLTFDGSPTLSGDYSFTAGSSVDLISVQGDIDISSLALSVENPDALNGLSYPILQCSETLTGAFSSDNLPGGWSLSYDYETGVATINRTVGTLIILR
ncbi:MAG: autotransporter-associated beta strand repeat-containing protein [Kiritimatiellae bacterium]|nr:autotransporter-associated beta strand repeat-containing protein [Kiritimatiellia bacterium]